MRKICVIGSNSFSGSSFIDLLLQDKQNQIFGISRSVEKIPIFLPYKRHKSDKFNFFKYDLNRNLPQICRLLSNIKPFYIVNFAAQSEVAPSWENPEQWVNTNVISLTKLVNFIKSAKYLKKFLQISTPEVYGSCASLLEENAPLNPTTPYAVSKAAADLMLLAYHKIFKFPVLFVRCANVYGATQQLHKIIPRTIILLKLGKKIPLHGGGKQLRSYIHIRDVSEGEKMILFHGKPGEIYHLSPNKTQSIKNIVKLICNKLQRNFSASTINSPERLGHDAAYRISSIKTRSQFGWQPRISLDEGIDEIINWININWKTINKLPLDYIHKP